MASRCIKFKFKPIPEEAQLKKLQEICEKERLNIHLDQLETLMKKGDLRQTINALQVFSSLPKLIPNILPLEHQIFEQLISDIQNAKNIKEIHPLYESVRAEGYAMDEFINGLVKEVMKFKDERKKSILLELISNTEEKLLCGASDICVYNFMVETYYVLNSRVR